MSGPSKKGGGGFHIGGGVTVTAGHSSVVGENNTTNTTITNTTTSTVEKGFAGDEQKQQFQTQIDTLRQALEALKTKIEASSLDDEKKDEVVGEILQNKNDLLAAKKQTSDVPTGKQAPADVATKVESALDRANGMADKLKSLVTSVGDVAGAVGEFGATYGPLILSARHLFGLP
jgi:hypothetical protein